VKLNPDLLYLAIHDRHHPQLSFSYPSLNKNHKQKSLCQTKRIRAVVHLTQDVRLVQVRNKLFSQGAYNGNTNHVQGISTH
jgi:hypothetical protein